MGGIVLIAALKYVCVSEGGAGGWECEGECVWV